ncbi:MAG: glycosyltransferase family 87 protein [Candidatus Sulfotelmatobacter sp.]
MSNSRAAWRSGGILCIVIVCAACMVYYHLALFVPRAHEIRAGQGYGNGYSFGADFYPIWRTSREGLLHHRNPYAPEMTRQIQMGLFGRPLDTRNPVAPFDYRAFAYPAFTDILFWPLCVPPFPEVRIVVALILPAITAISIVLWTRILRLRPGPMMLTALILLTLSSYAVLEGLFAEQMGLLVGFLLAAALAALAKGRLFLSGSLLALTLIKPQMTLMAAAYLLFWSLARWRARWRSIAGFTCVSALLVTSSSLVWPHWIPEWLRIIFGYRQYSTPPLVSYLVGTQMGSWLGPILIAVLLGGALAVAWRMRCASPTSIEFLLTISAVLAITAITLLPGHAVYDHIVLLPGVILIALTWRDYMASLSFRVILAVTALALVWQWITAPIVIAARPMVSAAFFSTLLTLPIRTAASIPFGVCALLGLMLWQGHRRKLTLTEKAPIAKPEAIIL